MPIDARSVSSRLIAECLQQYIVTASRSRYAVGAGHDGMRDALLHFVAEVNAEERREARQERMAEEATR